MKTFANYKPVKSDFWSGRIDDSKDPDSYRIHQVIKPIDLNQTEKVQPDLSLISICLLGFCCDEGVRRNLGRIGASKGPDSIRKEFANLAVRFHNRAEIYDAGNIFCIHHDLEKAQNELASAVKLLLDNKFFPIILGGGHEIAYGHYTGIQKFLGNKKEIGQLTGIINFDAHFDLRPYNGYGTSGNMFSQIFDDCQKNNTEFNYLCLGIQTYANTISLFKKADKLGVQYILAKDLTDENKIKNLTTIDRFTKNVDHIYITLCSDVFNASNAPGVSSGQPFGSNPETILFYIKHVLKSKKVISFDIAEVSPRFDHDHRTAKLASVFIYAVINTLIE